MNLSYTKANKMIKGSGEALELKLLDKRIGGIGGGGSRLTEEGIEFMKSYVNFDKEIKKISSQVFEKHFCKFI